MYCAWALALCDWLRMCSNSHTTWPCATPRATHQGRTCSCSVERALARAAVSQHWDSQRLNTLQTLVIMLDSQWVQYPHDLFRKVPCLLEEECFLRCLCCYRVTDYEERLEDAKKKALAGIDYRAVDRKDLAPAYYSDHPPPRFLRGTNYCINYRTSSVPVR